MRRWLAVACLAVVVVSFAAVAPVSAATCTSSGARQNCTFSSPVPCSVLCPYWTDPFDGPEAACRPLPIGLPMSYDQVEVTVPATANLIRAGIAPSLDSDLFVCRTVPDAQGHYFIASGANEVGTVCPLVVFGCQESAEFAAVPLRGQTIVLRVYNWIDVPSCPGFYQIV